ncbi:MAG: 50S ribosomal protein L6 [Nanoarchaeota archaeon]
MKKLKEIEMPDVVKASIRGQFLVIQGPKGEVQKKIKQKNVSIIIDSKKIILESKNKTKEDKKITGSLAAHIKNMIKGCTHSHMYTLKICSGHFPMNVAINDHTLILKNFIGEKVPRILQLKEGADVRIEGDLIHVTSVSKEIAGQVCADIEKLTNRPGYDTRIFQDGIYIINKDGKELK